MYILKSVFLLKYENWQDLNLYYTLHISLGTVVQTTFVFQLKSHHVSISANIELIKHKQDLIGSILLFYFPFVFQYISPNVIERDGHTFFPIIQIMIYSKRPE